MKKNIIDPKILSLDNSKNVNKNDNPLTKMELRQQQVRSNREKRQKEIEMGRKEKLIKKEVEMQARFMVEKEEKDNKIRKEIEQQLLDQEVNRLRIEMEKKHRIEEEKRKKYE